MSRCCADFTPSSATIPRSTRSPCTIFASPPDQNAFHEAFADIVALLSVFSVPEVVERLLGPADAQGTIAAAEVAPERLKRSALFSLAEELGGALRPGQGGGLRRSVDLLARPDWAKGRDFSEPHALGEVLVAAVMQTLHEMWTGRLRSIVQGERVNRGIVAEEGVKSAQHLLTMAIRSIDYTPPLEFEFKDFLDAMLVSDERTAPDDEHHYRDALRDAFGRFGIRQPQGQMIDLTRDPPTYEHINFEALRGDRDEVFRFLWENADRLDVCRDFYTVVDRVTPAARVGPDGFIVAETVATYLQTVSGTLAELERMAARPAYQHWSGGVPFAAPRGLAKDTEVQIWGGGALIFDQFGRATFHQTKPLLDWERQSRRLAHLVARGLADTRGRYGFSGGVARGQRFAVVHAPGDGDEGW